jgi:hypothetical protein
MDPSRLDRWTRSLTVAAPRRAALGVAALVLPAIADAKKHKKKRKRKKRQNKKVTFNAFGCVNVGGFCKNSDQCCSGICEGKQDKKRCKAHNASTCQPGQDICVVGPAICLTDTGDTGLCGRTTGGAGYCEVGAECFACQKDADCEPICGAGAACLNCPGCAGDPFITACAGQSTDSCRFPL